MGTTAKSASTGRGSILISGNAEPAKLQVRHLLLRHLLLRQLLLRHHLQCHLLRHHLQRSNLLLRHHLQRSHLLLRHHLQRHVPQQIWMLSTRNSCKRQ